MTFILTWWGWLIGLGQIPIGPLFAALIVVPIIGGKTGLRSWASRIVRWRVGLQWYAVALLLPLVVVVTASLITILMGAPAPTAVQLGVWPELIPEFFIVLIIVGLGEEAGFRGFALPKLQSGRSALTATLILAAIGVLWHLPLLLTGDSPWSNILIIFAGYVIFSWLFNNTNGSVLIVMLFHASVAVVGPSYFATMFDGIDFVRYSWLLAVIYAVVAFGVIAWSGATHLSRKPANQIDMISEPLPAHP